MNSDWQSFLAQAGATIEHGVVTCFDSTENEIASVLDSDVMADLSHFALIEASGDDARDFLQGQTSNDLRLVDAGHSQLNSYCSPKGRMLALFRLFERDGAFYLQMPAEVQEATLKRLSMFILRSKVLLKDVSGELVRFGIAGPNAEQLLATHIGTVPKDVDASTSREGVTIIRLAGQLPRFEIIGAAERLQSLWQALSTDVRPVGSDSWTLLDIHAGLPNILAANVEAFVPQMTNLHLINGVSFKKGCYPGQEIVARMQYLGKLKRRMYLAHTASENRPAAGDKLFSETTESGQGTGTVIQSAPSPEGGYDLLVVVDINSWENGSVHLESASGPQVVFRDLPYEFETKETA
jgi:folate-binding protein YgfZ